MQTPPTDQCIVLPFRPRPTQPFNGIGLALHFLAGNVLVLHSGLKEMWFGWRVDNIFPQQETFHHYCREASTELDLARVSRQQKVRFWIHGRFSERSVRLHLFDARQSRSDESSIAVDISTGDDLIDFRSRLMRELLVVERPIPPNQIQAALWPERIDRKGLDAVGRALETFYLYSAYGGKTKLDPGPFQKAVARAPDSFMAHDLLGWALYRNNAYAKARGAFLTALGINPAGAGAMSGLMWCGVYGRDLEEALYWSARKADVCGRDVQAARESARRRFLKVNP